VGWPAHDLPWSPPALVAGRKQRGRQSRRRAGHATSIADARLGLSAMTCHA